MKKFVLLFVLIFSTLSTISAQVDGKAIGVRFGGIDGIGAEVSYQHPLGSSNRLETDLGINSWGLSFTGIYQWVWDLSALADGFNWYAGVGGILGIHDGDSNNSNFGLGVAGQVGIEYNFNIPLQLSLDYRPAVYVLPSFNGGYDGICLSVRYKF